MSKLIVANWKMNPNSVKEAENIFKETFKWSKNIKGNNIVICPPFPYLFISKKYKSKNLFLGAQNVSEDIEGAHTGEVSPNMLKNFGVSYALVGHSERRLMGETNNMLNGKILNLLKSKIYPILCVGESNRDKEGKYLSVIEEQVRVCLKGVPRAQMKNIIIAYEPVWAIGKNAVREATREEFMEMKIFIKKVISDMYDLKTAHSIPVLYGGSVNNLNAKTFTEDDGADGLLIGRDSLDPKKFSAILKTLN